MPVESTAIEFRRVELFRTSLHGMQNECIEFFWQELPDFDEVVEILGNAW